MPDIGMLSLILYLTVIESVSSYCSLNQLPCDNGECINEDYWCDVTVHCKDSSDESNCPYLGTGSSNPQLEAPVQDNEQVPDLVMDPIALAMDRASKWLLGQLGSDYGWEKNTPRAIVALSLASTVPLNQSIKDTMAKQLQVLLNLELSKNGARQDMDLTHLSLFINALMATCQDPRNFKGFDLVGQLRSRVTRLMVNEFVPPSAFLALCMANQTVNKDMAILDKYYEEFMKTTSMLDTQALLIMALSCVSKTARLPFIFGNTRNFRTKFSVLKDYDHYKSALAIQALNSIPGKRYELVESERLASLQLKDGSFSDVLGTYLALPALAGKSLLNIKQIRCSASDNTNANFIQSRSVGDISTVKYSIWMGKAGVPDSHTISISFSGNQSLYEIMQLAESRNNLLRFSFDDTEDGKMVYSLAGIPNDVERDQRWETYVNWMDAPMVVNTRENLTPYNGGIDKLRPSNKSHIVFWLRQGKN